MTPELSPTQRMGCRDFSAWLRAGLCALASAVLFVCAFPPVNMAEAAWVFAVPLLLLIFSRHNGRVFWLVTFASGWLAWVALLVWLRHVYPPWGLFGALMLAAILAVFWFLWFAAARRLLPAIESRPIGGRLLMLAGLAGLWVLLEWLRGWIFTGFPWLPLSASQWLRPALLQPAAYAGHYAVSFVLIFFNLALACYLRRIFIKPPVARQPEMLQSPFRSIRLHFCPEFYVALALMLWSVWLFALSFPRQDDAEPLFRAGIVQPWIPAELKWDPAQARESLRVLERETEAIAALQPDIIFWPEAATPLALERTGDLGMFNWVAALSGHLGVPVMGGFLSEVDGEYLNAVYLVQPHAIKPEMPYAKQRLVPFGEYVPLRGWIPFVQRVVPIPDDISPGKEPRLLTVAGVNGALQAGSLVCYEDIFPGLARQQVRRGADFFLVVTNNAWYGEEAGAYQHAAHSVLRAVETRRPVVRSGNHGWSGWIDEYGVVREVLTNADGSIYFRGGGVFTVYAEPHWIGRKSVYVQKGDWFVGFCALLLLLAVVYHRKNTLGGQSS